MEITDDTKEKIGLATAVENTFNEHRLNGPIVESFIEGLLVRLLEEVETAGFFGKYELGNLRTSDSDFSFYINRMHRIHLKKVICDVDSLAQKMFDFSIDFDAAFSAKHNTNYRLFSSVEKARTYARDIVTILVKSQPDFAEHLYEDKWEASQEQHAISVNAQANFTLFASLDKGVLPKIYAVIAEKIDGKTYTYHFGENPAPTLVNGTPKNEVLLVPTESMREFLLDNPGIFDGLRNLPDFEDAHAAIDALNDQIAQLTERVSALQL